MAASPLSSLPLDELRLRWAASPVPGALARWWGGLQALLPQALVRLLLPPTRRLWLRLDGEAVELIEEAGRECETPGVLSLHDAETAAALAAALDRRGVDGELWLLLPARQALLRTLPLPLAAESRIDGLMQHEIDRQTPFSAEQVVFAATVLSRDAASGQLQAELAVLPRTALAAALAALGPLAARLNGADIDDAAHRAGRRRNLLPLAQRRPRVDRDGRVRALLAAAAVLALLLAGVATLHNREQAVVRLAAERDAAFDRAREARALRLQLDTAIAATNFLAEQRAARPTMLELLDDLTRRLPDDAFVTRLSVEQDRVVITGAARSAGALVATLQQSPFLKGPALAGSLRQDPRTGRDEFTVLAQLAPGEPYAPTP